MRVPGAGLFTALTLASAINFGFHGVVSRMLGVVDYGSLGALVAALAALSVPTQGIQVALTGQYVRSRQDNVSVGLSAATRSLAGASGALSIVLVLASGLVAGWLHLPSRAAVIWTALHIVPMALAIAPRAALLGQGRHRLIGATAVGGALARVGLSAAAIGAGGGVTGAMAGGFVAESLVALVLLAAARGRSGAAVRQLRVEWRSSVGATAAFTGVLVLLTLDTLLARHYLAGAVAGGYIAAATLARAVLFLPQAATTVSVARFASSDEASGAAALRWCLAVCGTIAVAGAVALTLAARPVLSVLFGDAVRPPGWLLALLVTACAMVALLQVLVHYAVATGRRAAAGPWLGVVVLAAGAVAWHSLLSLATLAVVAAVVALGTATRTAFSTKSRHVPLRPALCLPLDRDAELDLTVVVPFYNPGALLRGNLLRLIDALQRAGVHFEVIAVADGCTDGSPDEIADLQGRGVRVIRFERNAGKGAALRAGLRDGRGRYLGFIDADGDLEPALWTPFLELMRLYRPDVIVGSKRHSLSQVDVAPLRRLYSWGYQTLVRWLFRLPVRDTQVGIKLFRREVLVDVLPRTVERRFALDVELLAVARRLGYRRFLEAPVVLKDRMASTVSCRAVVHLLVDTVAVAWRLWVSRGYDALPIADIDDRVIDVQVSTRVLQVVG